MAASAVGGIGVKTARRRHQAQSASAASWRHKAQRRQHRRALAMAWLDDGGVALFGGA